jgi:uncharacterized protein YdcH (DUF465 family)
MQRASRNVDMGARLEALRRRHAECDERLKSFDGRHYLTPDEETEVKRLKKMKLLAKDEISRIVTTTGNA